MKSASRFCTICRYKWPDIFHGDPFLDRNQSALNPGILSPGIENWYIYIEYEYIYMGLSAKPCVHKSFKMYLFCVRYNAFAILSHGTYRNV